MDIRSRDELRSAVSNIHPSFLERKIVHVDMDAFYASVEIRDNPSLAGRPVIVGGAPDSRGVVATASYEARKFGVRSAMACSHAARLCPQAIFIRPDFEKYRAVSHYIREIFSRHTPIIEPVSLDEAYLDVTAAPGGLYAIQIAKKIQQTIWEELSLSCSAGVAPNKMLAKIASDLKKPGGISVVLPNQVTEFMRELPLRRINGIGPATEERLAGRGLVKCSDVWGHSLDELAEMFGERMARWLECRSRGIDERAVQTSRERKSIGCEETFARDVLEMEILHRELAGVARELARRMQKRNLCGRTLTLKIKYNDFTQVTRAGTYDDAFGSGNSSGDDLEIGVVASRIYDAALPLLAKTGAGQRPVRLVGLSVKVGSGGTDPSATPQDDEGASG